ncbi:hypothetical protein [Psychroserpens damuponensis]|uniref:hypothetical protein n=1 Tax=Psychroserpens damuponensis TaxID=943936 RepID=UPI000A8C8FFC|nr:hypothetical protein [Psychroserpens damuponensis]
MLKVILVVVGLIALTIGIVWLIDKFVPKKLKPVINIVLWALIIFLGYLTFNSVYGEIKFNKLKDERYKKVIVQLIDIRDAELAHKTVKGQFTSDYGKLVNFIETGKFTITQRRDTTVVDEELTKRFGGVTMTKSLVLIDTLGFVSVKDSLFGADSRYKTMMNLPEGIGPAGSKINLDAGVLAESKIPVFVASVDKEVILFDQDKNLVAKEKEVMSVDGVRGSKLQVGSMQEADTKGNWPKNLSTNN